MKSKIKTTAITCIILTVLYQYELSTNYWDSSNTIVINSPLNEIYKFITNADLVEKWFYWIPHLQPADSRVLGVGKQYKVFYRIPFLGDRPMIFKIVQFTSKSRLVLESEDYLKPRVEIDFESEGIRRTKIKLLIGYRRYNLLFHICAAPFLCYVTNQQIQDSLSRLQMFF